MNSAPDERTVFADWITRVRLRSSRVIETIYLPTNSPGDEVRLLDVWRDLFPEPSTPFSSSESKAAVGNLRFRLCTLTVSEEEWSRIKGQPDLLPTNWTLDGAQTFRRPA